MKTPTNIPVTCLLAILCVANSPDILAQTPAAGDTTGEGAAPSDEENNASDLVVLGEFVVTGTQIRGVEPVGTNVVGLSREGIIETGSLDTNQLLAQVPQITSAFNQVPVLPSTDPGNSVIRPQLRNFGTVSGSSSTLVMIDGHRTVGAGITITAPDPGIIPPAVLERIDVVPDGGSAIYGSDAVAGVINFVTRRRFDGVQFDARYGFADNYHQWDTNLTVGKDWGKGGAYISYSRAERDALLGRDLDWFRQTTPNEGYGMPGTVLIDGTTYALPDRVPGTIAQVDNLDGQAFVPKEQRDSLFGVFNQELTDTVDLDVRAFYSKRTNDIDIDSAGGTSRGEGVITPANPFWVPIGSELQQTVRFSYGSLLRVNELEEYGVAATVTADISDDWQIRGLLNWGRSNNSLLEPNVDQGVEAAALAATTTDTALNPYDLSRTNPAVLESIFWMDLDRGRQTMKDARVILDGSVFKMPGGEIRLAVGGEYTEEEAVFQFTNSPTETVTTRPSRDITAFFGEVVIPLVGPDNAVAGIHSLSLSAAIRHDDYSDVGSTTNPRLGLSYKPVDWMTVRGNWGESFIAPSVADTSGAPDTRGIFFSFSPFILSSDRDGVNEFLPQILLAGGNADLQPQTAKTWSAGFDIKPPAVKGLTVSATLYNIETENEISNLFAGVFAPQGTDALYQPQYSRWVIKNPSQSFTEDYISGITAIQDAGGGNSIAGLYALGGGSIYSLVDFRRQNLSLTNQEGIDFSVKYDFDTKLGSMTADVGGSYLLKRDVATAPGAAIVDSLDSPGINRLTLSASLGVTRNNVSASATVRHNAGYDISPAVSGQTSVDSFTTVDLFVSYDLEGAGWRRGLTLTAFLGNVFDEEPPRYNSANGFANGSTLGRLFQVGVSKRF